MSSRNDDRDYFCYVLVRPEGLYADEKLYYARRNSRTGADAVHIWRQREVAVIVSQDLPGWSLMGVTITGLLEILSELKDLGASQVWSDWSGGASGSIASIDDVIKLLAGTA